MEMSVVGVIGVGTINAAVIRGLCTCISSPYSKFLLSPRNSAKGEALKADFPSLVHCMASNQAVVDGSDIVLVGVLPGIAEEILSRLIFHPHQQIISLIGGVHLAELQKWIQQPVSSIGIATPLPAVAHQRGTTLVCPPLPVSMELFGYLGVAVPMTDQEQNVKLQSITGLMGTFYAMLDACQSWAQDNGVDGDAAAKFIGSVFHTISADSARAESSSAFAELVAEQTPGGYNEMAVTDLSRVGVFEAIKLQLDRQLARKEGQPMQPLEGLLKGPRARI
jgi:pyrroline-5-carboxylate reductase